MPTYEFVTVRPQDVADLKAGDVLRLGNGEEVEITAIGRERHLVLVDGNVEVALNLHGRPLAVRREVPEKLAEGLTRVAGHILSFRDWYGDEVEITLFPRDATDYRAHTSGTHVAIGRVHFTPEALEDIARLSREYADSQR